MRISELLLTVPTDKNHGVIEREKGHYYGESYDRLLGRFPRDMRSTVLEIGVQKGGSLKVWSDYFTAAEVIGIDIVDVREPEFRRLERVRFIHSDVKLADTSALPDGSISILIDDGSHHLADVLWVTAHFHAKMRVGGLLIIEDTQAPLEWLLAIFKQSLRLRSCYRISYRNLRPIGHYDDFLIVLTKVRPAFFLVVQLWNAMVVAWFASWEVALGLTVRVLRKIVRALEARRGERAR